MNRNGLIWVEKYRPRRLKEMVGNRESLDQLNEWIKSWQSGVPEFRALLLLGPPGVGKTSAVSVMAAEHNLELVEFNASDRRNKDAIETLVWRAATQETIDGRRRLILLDEIDGLSGTSDRGGTAAIISLIEQTAHPIVMTANDEESPRVKDLRKSCEVLRFNPLTTDEIEEIVRAIVDSEGLGTEESIIQSIARQSHGDARAAISDLEAAESGQYSTDARGLPSRDVQRRIGESLARLFMASSASTASLLVSETDLDQDQLILWLEENVHLHLVEADELEAGLEALSMADVLLGRITRTQNWKLLTYAFDFMSAGIVASRTKTPFRHMEYTEPSWPLMVWQGNKSREKQMETTSRISALANISERRAVHEYLQTVRDILYHDPEQKTLFADWLDISEKALEERGVRR
ncbi:MAG: replication factor C large subunit [Candidatus Thorarchaeota archaeon]|nr:replication factor C large subunit [Candidatus Thorarchaeota archaeon]